MGSSKIVKGQGDYTLSLTQSKLYPGEMALANTDFTIQLFDLNTMTVALTFD
jgi:WD40 repeat protein